MDRLSELEAFERDVTLMMRDQGIDRGEAEVLVAMRRGELVGDVLFVHTLTDDERKEHSRTLDDVMAEHGELRQAMKSG